MKALLTNDDGIEAAGLAAVRGSLLEAGFDVVVVAPEENRSGLARACTPRRPVSIERLSPGDSAFACDGTPVDCVRVGLLGQVAAGADLVVCGINHGANLGDDCLYSATVGAGMEAALLGRPALCLSQQPDDGSFRFRDAGSHSFAQSAGIAAELARAIVACPPSGRAVVNVNFPSRLRKRVLEVTRLGQRREGVGRIVQLEESAGGASFYVYGLAEDPDPPHEDGPGTDFGALGAGRISATPMSLSWDMPDHDRALRGWLAEIGGTALAGAP